MIQKDDNVIITNKNNIRGVVVGFYAHSGDAIVRTDTGNEWIVKADYLMKEQEDEKKA